MDENKDKTVKFEPIAEEIIKKEEIRRKSDDVYSEKRHSAVQEEDGNNSLLYVVIALAVVIIVLLVVGIFFVGKMNTGKVPEENITKEELQEETEETLLKEEEEIEETILCDIVFYGDSVIRKNSGFSILADIYDGDKKTDHRKILIDQSTKIYEDGERMNAEGFVYTIESLAGERIYVEGEIREEDGYAISLKYDLGLEEVIGEETEEHAEEEITEEIEEPLAEEEKTESTEDIIEGTEGIIVE